MGNDQTILELNYSSNINHFYRRERTEQKLKNINIYGLVRMLGKSIKIRSAGAEPKRKERSFSTRLISQEIVLSWRLTVLRETDLSGFSTQMLFEVFIESKISWGREGTNLPVYAYRSYSHFCLSFLRFSFFLFPPLFSISLFLFLSSYFLVEVLVVVPPFWSQQDLLFIVLPWQDFIVLALNSLCLVWVYWPTITVPFVCHLPITKQGRVFCLLVRHGTLSCYGLGSFSLPIPHGMHIVVPTQLASFR